MELRDPPFGQVLRGGWEVDGVRGGQDLDGAAFGAAVSAVVLEGSDRGLGPRLGLELREQTGLVLLDGQQVVRVLVLDQEPGVGAGWASRLMGTCWLCRPAARGRG